MKLLIISIFIFFAGSSSIFEQSFKDDYSNAVSFLKSNKNNINKSCSFYKNSARFLSAIIFPELIRYSYFKDFFETTALELVYVKYGAKYADFSIGRFQMKPSFAEQVEAYCENDSLLSKKYRILSYSGFLSSDKKRLQRISRLKSTNWQLVYLNCFINIVETKFTEIVWKNESEKVKFYASVYNCGINKPIIEIEKQSSKKLFPFGNGDPGNICSYSDVACDFYLNRSSDIY